MKHSKLFARIVLIAVISAMCITLFAGCTGASKKGSGPAMDGEDINLPEVDPEMNKDVTIFVAQDSLDDLRSEDGKVGWVEIAEQQYDLNLTVSSFVDSTRRITLLSALYMSGEMPDYISAADYPICLGNNYIQDVSPYIDLDDPMWEDVLPMMDNLKWNDKYYFLVNAPLEFSIWTVWNPEILEENGIESPLKYYEEGTWTWDKLKEIAVKATADTNDDGENDIWGLGVDGAIYPLHFSTGVNLLEVTSTGFKLNFTNEKIASAAQFWSTMGPVGENVVRVSGTGVMSSSELLNEFANGKIATMLVANYAVSQEPLVDMWEKGTIDFCPTPQWMGENQYYTYAQPACAGIGADCKNPEGGALVAQIVRYCNTDEYYDKYWGQEYVDRLQLSAYKTKCNMTDEQLQRIADMRDIAYSSEPIAFTYYNFWGFDDGFMDMLVNDSWSQAVERIVPIAEDAILDWENKLNSAK